MCTYSNEGSNLGLIFLKASGVNGELKRNQTGRDDEKVTHRGVAVIMKAHLEDFDQDSSLTHSFLLYSRDHLSQYTNLRRLQGG